jgi:hypothetical protein
MFSRRTTLDLGVFVLIVAMILATLPRIAPKKGPRISIYVWFSLIVVMIAMSIWNLLEVH